MKSIPKQLKQKQYFIAAKDTTGDIWYWYGDESGKGDWSYAQPIAVQLHFKLMLSLPTAKRMVKSLLALSDSFWNRALEDFEHEHEKLTIIKKTVKLYAYATHVEVIDLETRAQKEARAKRARYRPRIGYCY